MAPTLITSYPVTTATRDFSTLTTSSFTPTAGEVIVVTAFTGDTPATITGISNSGTAQTWTTRSNTATASNCPAALFTCTVGASPSAMTVSVTFGGSTANAHTMTVTRWSGAQLAGSPAVAAVQSVTTGTTTITTTGTGSVVVWGMGDWNAVSPGTPTYSSSATQIATPFNTGTLITRYDAYQAAASAGSQTIGVTSPTGQKDAIVGIELQSAFTPISASDTGTGTDSVGSILAATTSIDTGTGVDAVSGTASGTVTDSGTGADSAAVLQLLPLTPITDTGTGSDSVAIVQFFPVNLTDTGTGADSVSGLTGATTATDTGTGTDSISALKAFPPTLADTGTGVDSFSGSAQGVLSDTGIGVDSLSIVNIPFAQIIPAFRPGPVYDLVVMARVPQQFTAPVFLQVDPIEWTTLSYINTLSTPQTLNVQCLISSLPDTVITRFRDLATQPTELWLFRDGHLIFAGPVMGGNARALELDITAMGVLAYTTGMFVTADQVYSNVDQFTVVKGLVDAWQKQDYGNFGIDTSKLGTSGVTISPTYLASELRNVSTEISSLATSGFGFDYEVDPITRQLLCWYPTKGVDRSTGDNAVIFDARNISSTDFMFSVSPQDLATEAFTTGTASTGTGNLYATASNTALRTQYGRTGYAQSFNNVADQTTLNHFASGLLTTRSAELITPGTDARDVPDADISSYSVGDTIMYQPNPLLTVPRAYRIRRQTVNVSSTGVETISLEFA